MRGLMRSGTVLPHCLHFAVTEFAYSGIPQLYVLLAKLLHSEKFLSSPFGAHEHVAAIVCHDVELRDEDTDIAHESFCV